MLTNVNQDLNLILFEMIKKFTIEEDKTLKQNLGVKMLVLKNAGHISNQSGYGEWGWVLNWTKEHIK